MSHNFGFNSTTHNYWDIYEIIKRYYPIGINQNEGRGIHNKYNGLKELEAIIVENIHVAENYRSRWTNFTRMIGNELEKQIEGRTYGQAPSFSSSILLESNQIENCLHSKELHFSVSLIGEFYQIYGLDLTTVIEQNEDVGYSSINVITTSPFEEFRDSFELVEDKILEKHPTHRIIPFSIGQSVLKGLQVGYIDDENCSINQALFNHFLGEENLTKSIRGNKYYGESKWEI